jgi:hypothetical protein
MQRPEPQRFRLTHAPRTVVGYHGCSQETARKIIAGEPFFASANEWDWLGDGVYFWEYAPSRAREWAERRHGSHAAVLEARIRLRRCLNLLDTGHFADIRRTFDLVLVQLSAQGLPIPENKPDGRRYLDRRVINLYCRVYSELANRQFHTVRGCFPEGEPIYPGSAILSHTHIQVAVRDPRCIERVRLVYFE